MSNLVPANIQVPAHLTGRIGSPSTLSAALIGGLSSGGSFPRISIKGGRFRIVEGDSETVLDTTALNVVIVGANPRLSKVWYASQWTPDKEPTAPDCFSLDGIRPNPEATNPQSDLCATCPQNAWGSKVTPLGQQVKACADQKRLAVVAAGDPSGPIYLLQVTPAALKNLAQYQRELAAHGIPPEVVKTRVSFDLDASFPKLVFSFAGFLDEETQRIIDDLVGSDQVKEITGEKTVNVSAQLPKSAADKSAAEKLAEKPAADKPVAGQSAVEKLAEKPAAEKPAAEKPAVKRGFGATKPMVEQPVSAAKTAAAAASLADEIAALVRETMIDDDEDEQS